MAYKVFAEDIAAPFSHMVFFSSANQSKEIEKMLGMKIFPHLQEITNSKVKWCLDDKNFEIQARKVLEKLENPKFYQKIIKESYPRLKEFEKEARRIQRIDYSPLDLKKIASNLEKLIKTWLWATIPGVIVNHADFHFGFLSAKVEKIIEEKLRKSKFKISLPEAFALLTTPLKRSKVVNQEIELLEILKEIKKFKIKSIENVKKTPLLMKKIKRHKEKYDWLQYGYIGPTILDEEYFLPVLEGFLKEKISPQKKIKEIFKKEKETKEKQKELKRKLKFSSKEWYWIEMAKEFIYLKGLRKEITFIASRALFPLLSEVAKRFNLSFKQVIQLSVDEMFTALRKKKLPSLRVLNERIKYCVVYYPNKREMVYIKGKAKKLAKKIVEEKIEEIKELKGNIAYPGKVKGEVKLIFGPEDIKKMNKGDILVSPATNPNVMPAIVKASAIVTDEGGITCHAAIVSRELKIPCIIGTKIATKVLKDGDLVEVDAEKGIVRIIK